MNIRTHLLGTVSSLCSIEGEGQEGAAGGGGQAAGGEAQVQQTGGVQRVQVGNTGEADAEATARSNGVEAPAVVEGLPEGFDSVEAFVKAVNDGTYKPAGTGEAAPEAKAPAVELPDDPKFAPYTAEFAEKGALSEDSVAKAAKEFLGEDTPLNRAMVQTYVDALKNQGDAAVTTAQAPFHEAAGGATQYAEFRAWTAQAGHVPDAQAAAVNTLLAQGKTAEALAVMQPLMDAWKADGGGKPARDLTRETGKGADVDTASGDTFANWPQVTVAMNDPRYSSDPAYRAEVEAKIGRSKLN